MVEWLVSESMVMYYIHLFRDSMWPGGELTKPAAQRTDLVKESIIIIMNNFCYCQMLLLSLSSSSSSSSSSLLLSLLFIYMYYKFFSGKVNN